MRLRALRRSRELTLADVARRVGVTTSTVCDYERGRRKPSFNVAIDLETLFGTPVKELFEYVEVPA